DKTGIVDLEEPAHRMDSDTVVFAPDFAASRDVDGYIVGFADIGDTNAICTLIVRKDLAVDVEGIIATVTWIQHDAVPGVAAGNSYDSRVFSNEDIAALPICIDGQGRGILGIRRQIARLLDA